MATPAANFRDAIPRPSEQPLEVDYLQNRHPEYSNDNIVFDPENKKFVPQPLPIAVRRVSFDTLSLRDPHAHELQIVRTTESFKNAVERLVKQKSKDKQLAEFNLSNVTSWSDVNTIMAGAEKKYANMDSTSGKIRNFFHKIGDNGKSIKSFVGLLPDGNYKTLCGGLTLILSAMVGHSQIREKMAQVMEELPEDVTDSEDYAQIYGDRGIKVLRQCVEELYVELLATFEDFVEWYMQSTGRHIRDSLLKNENYAQSIDLRLQSIRKSRMRFQATTRKLLHITIQRIRDTTNDTNERVQESQMSLRRMKESVDDAKKGAQGAEFTLMRRMSGLQTNVLNGIQSVLEDKTKNAAWQKQMDHLRESLRESERKRIQEAEYKDKIIAKLRMQVNEVSYSPTSLAEALGLDLSKEGYSNEYKEVYSHGLRESSEYQDRSRWISESLEFSHWIGANESSFLLIQENATQEHTSPLSFFQSLLYPKLAESTNVLVLSFFCGRHTGSRFPDSGEPSGVLLLARSLLVQILGVMTIDWDTGNDGLSFLSLKPEEVKRMDRGSVAAYTRLTSKLISALLAQFVGIFVMIDGVDFYDLAWEREVKFMVKSLLKLADLERDASLGVLKVLFTTSTHANASWSKSDKVVIIDMSDKIRWERDSFEELDVSKEWLVA